MPFLINTVPSAKFATHRRIADNSFVRVIDVTGKTVHGDATIHESLDGYTALPAPVAPLPPVPEEVGRGQLFAAFIAEGWFASDDAANAAIEAAIDTVPAEQREVVRALFRNATVFRRANPFLPVVQAALGKTDAQRDALLRRAVTF